MPQFIHDDLRVRGSLTLDATLNANRLAVETGQIGVNVGQDATRPVLEIGNALSQIAGFGHRVGYSHATTSSAGSLGWEFAQITNHPGGITIGTLGGFDAAVYTATGAARHVTQAYMYAGAVWNLGTGTIAQASAFQAQPIGANAGIVTLASGFFVADSDPHAGQGSGGTAPVTQHGVHIANLTAGATNVGVYIEGASTYALHADSGRVVVDEHILIGATALPAGMTGGTGLVVNGQNANFFMLTDTTNVASGLTTGVIGPVVSPATIYAACAISASGGLFETAVAEAAQAFGQVRDVWCGAPDTTDTSGSLGAANYFVGQHNGSNAKEDMAAGSNGFVWGEIDASGNRLTRMLLKVDTGALHLGNTTLVALDDEDDVGLVRAMQRAGASGGIIESPYDNPFESYERLREVGLAGEMDEEGFFLFPLQSRLHAHEGAIWQTSCDFVDTVRVIANVLPGLRPLLPRRVDRRLARLEAA